MASPRTRGAQRASESARHYGSGLKGLGLRIRQLRQKRRLTLEQAAEAMDMDVTHLTKIEAGTINLTFATMVRIASGLGVQIVDLFAEH